jgi:hypothetical protein
MDDGDPIGAYTDIPSSGINNLEAVPFLFPDVAWLQLVRVEEFNDLAFKEHEKISFPIRELFAADYADYAVRNANKALDAFLIRVIRVIRGE